MKGKNTAIDQILNRLGIEALNDMQVSVLSASDKHKDIQVLSPTGTGKTLSYLLPLSQQVNASLKKNQALIICPTRELVLQVESVFKKKLVWSNYRGGTPFKMRFSPGRL